MIKLTRHSIPSFLTTSKITELTDEYKKSGKSVWNTENIKTPLLASSNNKCAYCECVLTKESNYMEVEHFEDKKHNPDKVVEWLNLLPSCKRCNGSKGTHDVIKDPIVNPYDDDPREHFAWRLYRLRGKTLKGMNSIDVCSLNHRTRLVMGRFEVGEKINELIDIAFERYATYLEKHNTRSKNKLTGIVEGMLIECQPDSEYSASTATMLLTDSKFQKLITALKSESMWTDELEHFYQEASQLVLECA